ncbi:MAG: thioester domain-containing protein [Solirubrobacteraceae bacterium]
MRVTDWFPGQRVTGYIANSDNPFNPVTGGYPSDPTDGWTPKNEDFAGVIHGDPVGGGETLNLYCIDINTDTWSGLGYHLGSWDAGGVSPNVGYVARLLNDYYPRTNEPASLTDPNQKAAAVQAAIWFFSDRYVLRTDDPLHAAVVAIVNKVKKDGQLVQPPPPTLTITPASASGPADSAVGPFTVSTGTAPQRRRGSRDAGQAIVTATGGSMFSNRAGTVPIADGATVPSGQTIWIRSKGGSSSAVLEATATATVPSGNVYLYDGNTVGVDDAQRLILAQNATLTTTVHATAQFLPPGWLKVNKTIAGPAAGSQGTVVIQVVCNDGKDRADLVIKAGADAGTTSMTYRGIPAGAMCTVTETASGSTKAIDVDVTGNGQQVTIPSGDSKTVDITDTYHFVPGSLLVRKTIAGPGAGQQGAITIHSVCNGKAVSPDFVLAAGTPTGSYTKQYDQIPAGATCTVTETADGHTSAVSVVVTGSGQKVSVPAGDIIDADLSDSYGLLPGQLEVTKTITGPLAGHQGSVVIHTVCTPAANTPDFSIGAGATGVQSQTYSGISAGASCVVTETANGQSNAVTVAVNGSPQTATIPAGGAAVASITDSYGAAPGSLLVTKTISGPLAGHQGPVTIHLVCNGVPVSPDWVIAARTRAGTVSHNFDGIPAGSACVVAETSDGATATVMATVAGNGQGVTVPAGSVVAVSLLDVYRGTPGFLKVTKKLAGRAARQHGRIAILAACGGPLYDFVFRFPGRTGTGLVSRWFAALPAGARCTVNEVAIGRTRNVAVVAIGRRQRVNIRANRRASVRITDVFRRIAKIPVPRVTG